MATYRMHKKTGDAELVVGAVRDEFNRGATILRLETRGGDEGHLLLSREESDCLLRDLALELSKTDLERLITKLILVCESESAPEWYDTANADQLDSFVKRIVQEAAERQRHYDEMFARKEKQAEAAGGSK